MIDKLSRSRSSRKFTIFLTTRSNEDASFVSRRARNLLRRQTGWAPPEATLQRIELITSFVHGAIKVKASGGIRDFETVVKMCGLGVMRFGINTAAAVSILASCHRAYNKQEAGEVS
jgi:deoxyribose-phosphate aldolase